MNRFIEHIINDLVRDTKIDYDKEEITHAFLPLLPLSLSPPFFPPLAFFSKYCKNRYGLTEEEIEYVWVKYKDIILDKITNR